MKRVSALIIIAFFSFISIVNAQNPTVTTFSPTTAGPGTTVIVVGSNFTGVTNVSFGGVSATSFTLISSTALTAVVGYGASGSVSVSNSSGTGSMAGFTYIAPVPTITSFTPASGAIGSTVTITGTGFSSVAANNIVYFGATKANITNATATSLNVVVPSGATYQPLSVTANNLSAYSTVPFMVTFNGGGALDANSYGGKSEYTTGAGPNFSGIQDIDGDGKPDLISVNQSANTISLFRNTSIGKNNISFTSKVDLNSGYFPLGAAFADFDGDGKPDMVVSNYYDYTIGVFKNNSSLGNISFSSMITYSTGSRPGYPIVADVDGDGKPDIIEANNSSNTISIFLNTSTLGNISFASKTDISVGSAPSLLGVADLDGDGKIDIVCPNQGSSNVSILRNTSTGKGVVSFSVTSITSGTGSSGPRGVSIGDLDGDGKPDIVVANSYNSTISVFRNLSSTGNISFAAKSDYSLPTGTTTMTNTISDLDGDGKLDILIPNAGSNNYITAFRNNSTLGSIILQSYVNYTVGASSSSPSFISVGDIDGDGKPDIVTANTTSNTLSVIRNQINEPVVSSFSPTSAASGSTIIITGVNFTGTTAVYFGGVAASSFQVVSSTAIIATVGAGASGTVSVITPNGTNGLSGFSYLVPVPTITSFTPTSGPIGTSITITGKNFSATPANNIVYFGAVKATVSEATTTSLTVKVPVGASYLPISVTTAGMTSYSLSSFDVTFSGGGSAFTASSFSTHKDTTASSTQSILLGDFDGDGKSDYVYVNTVSSGTVQVYRNTGTGKTIAFTYSTSTYTGSYPCCVSIADMDGDGKLDLVVTNLSSNTVSILLNTSISGVISFSSPVNFTTGSGPEYFAIADIDGDGRPDLIINAANSNTVWVLLNTGSVGNISFAAGVSYAVGSSPTAVAVADLNNDGKPDIAVTNTVSSSVTVYINRSTAGSLSFDSRIDYAITNGAVNLDIHDLDGDGKPDIIVPNYNGSTISILRNLNATAGASFTSASFATKVDYTVGSEPAGLSIADIDGDGKPDIAIANRLSNTVSLLRNTSTSGTIAFETKVDFTTATDPRSVVLGDVDNDGKPDILTANPNSSTVSILRNQIGEPVVSSFAPTSGGVGATIIINGSNFVNVTGVSFGAVAATSFTVVSSSAIIAIVGTGASGSVTVTTSTGNASLTGFYFTVPIPSITSFSPTSGAIGSTVTITGKNFSATAANNVVYFGNIKATVTSATATTLSVTVPTGQSYTPVTVTVNGLTAYATAPFNITFPGGGSNFTANTFSSLINFTNSSQVGDMAIGDLDNDGKPDLIGSTPTNQFSVFHNTGSAGNVSFAAGVNYNIASQPYGLSLGDFDGDGKLDVVSVSFTANASSTIASVYLNTSVNNNISLGSRIDITIGNSYSVNVADADGDGMPDIIATNMGTGAITILRNTSTLGNISFAAPVNFNLGTYGGQPICMTVGDLDNDGKPDIIAVSQNNNVINILKNNSTAGNLNFTLLANFSTGSGPRFVALSDFNGDGFLDIAVGNVNSNNVTIFKNTSTVGSISLSNVGTFGVGTSPGDIAIGDFDGDGKPDIGASCFGGNVVSILRNSSSGNSISFATTVNYSASNASVIQMGDIDMDGKIDVITSTTNNSFSILRNQTNEPIVTSFSPGSAGAGATIIINGSNFVNVTGVSFGGVPATSFTVVSSAAIIATVGTGTSGNVTVTTSTGSGTLSGFIFTAPPTISSFSPTKASTGKIVTINGTNFLGTTAVSFGGTPANAFTIVNATTITATVGTGSSGSVSVTTPYGTATDTGFKYLVVINRNVLVLGAVSDTTWLRDVKNKIVATNIFNAVDYYNANSGTPTLAQLNNYVAVIVFSDASYNNSITLGNNLASYVDSGGGVVTTTFNLISSYTLGGNFSTDYQVIIPGSSNISGTDYTLGTVAMPNHPVMQGITNFDGGSSSFMCAVSSLSTNSYNIANWSNGYPLIAAKDNVGPSNAKRVDLNFYPPSSDARTGFWNSTTQGGLIMANALQYVSKSTAAKISSFTPTSAGVGATILITGNNFANITSVSFGGVPAISFNVISSTAIVAYVGNGATGYVKITTSTDSSSLAGFTFIASTPTITSFSPAIASAGTTITIIGTNFTGATAVSFGGTPASSFVIVNATTITAVVGNGATGNITVTTAGGTANYAGFYYCNPAIIKNVTVNGCNSIIYKGSTYNSSTVLYDTLRTARGCDSIYNVTNISVTKITPVTQNIYPSGCNSVFYNGLTYTSSTIHTDTVKSTLGCDSIYQVASITVTKITPVTQNIYPSGCNSVLYNGITYTSSTARTDTIRSTQGCDSVYKVATITVTKITPVTQNYNVSGCNSVLFNGITYTISTVHKDTVRSTQGCDSVYKIATITVNKITPVIQNIYPSGCNSVLYNGITYTSSTIHKDTVRSTQGCDSIYKIATITVSKITPVTQNIYPSGCNSVLYNGFTYTSSTTHTDTVRSTLGCDSVYKVATITVTKITPVTQNFYLSNCNSVYYNGITYTTSAIHRDTVRSFQGCDSVYKVANITVTKITPVTQNIYPSGCNSVFYNGVTYNLSTIHRDTVKSVQGCDSVYKVATITVTKITPVTQNLNPSGCNSVLYNGITYTSSTIHNDTLRTLQGCDSVYKVANITVNLIAPVSQNNIVSGCDSVLYNGKVYYTSTNVTDTIRSLQGCDSVYKVANITVTPTPVITNINSNSPINIGDSILLSVTGTSGNTYSWNGPASFNSAQQNVTIYNATSLMSGFYSVTISNNGCTSIADSVSVFVSSLYTFNGRIWHPKGYYVKDVNISITGETNSTVISGTYGDYNIKLVSGGNYKIKPITVGRNIAALRKKDRLSVSSIDIALVQSHILQKAILNSPYKILAADVNSDGKVSALDIVFMKRLILNLDTSFPGNKLWAFVDSTYPLTNLKAPFTYKDSISFISLSGNKFNQTFTGFPLGDVNWSETSPRMIPGMPITLYYNNVKANINTPVSIPVMVKNFNDMIGFEYTLNYNNELLDFIGIENNILGIEYAIHEDGKISFLWNDPNNIAKNMNDGSVLFNLVFKPKALFNNEAIDISSDITAIESVDANNVEHEIQMQKGIISSELLPTTIEDKWEVVPNPTVDGIINVQMQLKENRSIIFRLTDINGKLVMSKRVEGKKGADNFKLLQDKGLPAGVYYLKAQGVSGIDIKKIIVQ